MFSFDVLASRRVENTIWSMSVQQHLRHDLRLRAAASVIYDACYPGEEWAPVGFLEAERLETVHYRQAVEAALRARSILRDRSEQLELI